MSEFFKFEDTSRDFPYYRQNPKISKIAWIVLLLTIPISFWVYKKFPVESEILRSILFALVLLLPLMYFSNWDFSLIFHKPTKSEIKLAVILFVGYLIYAFAIGEVLNAFGQNTVVTGNYYGLNGEILFSLVFSMLAEELIKFIPIMFFMRFVFKFTNDRKLSLVVSSTIVLIFFGLIHYDPAVNTIIYALLIPGLGSIFELYGYVKTKNLFVPYLCHLLTDVSLFLLMLLRGG
ncbi:type II CAAX prenyl endopeptidase Rce1 family protein [Methanobrevibacter sp.]|uniref:CPBP family glutamic-type intramembrane protease n=1 Tax=Methanobrevibacter sp. TaxID=66852 RepID=UPI0038906EA9